MKKKAKFAGKLLIVLFVILLVESIGVLYLYGSLSLSPTAFTINNLVGIKKNLLELPRSWKFSLMAQWIMFFLVIIGVYLKDIVVPYKKSHLSQKIQLKNNLTDIDKLYELLKRDKKITLSEAAKKFNISKSLAMEWFKILENNNLAIITYPFIGDAVLKLR